MNDEVTIDKCARVCVRVCVFAYARECVRVRCVCERVRMYVCMYVLQLIFEGLVNSNSSTITSHIAVDDISTTPTACSHHGMISNSHPLLHSTLEMFPQHTRNVPTVHEKCSHSTREMFPQYTRNVPTVHEKCSYSTREMFPEIST